MREIKFKVWNTIDKCFVSPQSSFFSAVLAVALNGSKHYEAIEYTGLRDKDGAEIHEGDIVYILGRCSYEAVFPFIELYEAQCENDVGAILGNVYENPELLEADL